MGIGDLDILYGDLGSEVARLRGSDVELLVPSNYFPTPLSNGNLLLFRSSAKMVGAFRRSDAWRGMLARPHEVYDEWWGSANPLGGFMEVLLGMHAAGKLVAQPTRRAIAQARTPPSHATVQREAAARAARARA